MTIRPIRPDDEPLMAAFHAGLSPRSVYQRYFHITTLEQRITQQRLALTCRVDPAQGVALVAEHAAGEGTSRSSRSAASAAPASLGTPRSPCWSSIGCRVSAWARR